MFQLEVNQVTILDDCWNFPDGKSTPGPGFLEQIHEIVVNPDMGGDEMSGGENCYIILPVLGIETNLAGGLEHEFYDFPFSWECHDPN